MNLNMKFEESNQRIHMKFSEVHQASDGGFEKGYEQGYTEGNENGYKDGYSEGQEQSASKFGIQNEVTGTGIVTCYYVNENEHEVEVKLSSDTITDFSDKQVKVIGKNLFNGKLIRGGWSTSTGNKLVNANDTRYACDDLIEIMSGVDYCISSDLSEGGDFWILYYDENKNYLNAYNTNFQSIPNRAKYITFYNVRKNNSLDELVQIETGITPTLYEPPIEPIYYTPNADGTVNGVTSFVPTMNFICEGVDITAKYYPNPNNVVCESEIYFSDKGTMYQENMVIPPNSNNGFSSSGYQDCKEMKTFSAPYFISKTIANYVFQGCSSLISASLPRYKHIGINFFYNCNKLETLELGSDEYPVVDIRINAFVGCSALKNVAIVGNIGSEGTAYAISFAQSSLLTNESVQNIIDALGDLTGKTSQTITFHADVFDKLTDEQKATITNKNWTLVRG